MVPRQRLSPMANSCPWSMELGVYPRPMRHQRWLHPVCEDGCLLRLPSKPYGERLLPAWDSWRRTTGDDRRQQSSEESTRRRIRTLCAITLFLRDLYAIGLTQLSFVFFWNVHVCTCIWTVSLMFNTCMFG
jgi:hypothetical protein